MVSRVHRRDENSRKASRYSSNVVVATLRVTDEWLKEAPEAKIQALIDSAKVIESFLAPFLDKPKPQAKKKENRMISDVLSDAISKIDNYLDDPLYAEWYSGDLRAEINSLREAMEKLRIKLEMRVS